MVKVGQRFYAQAAITLLVAIGTSPYALRTPQRKHPSSPTTPYHLLRAQFVTSLFQWIVVMISASLMTTLYGHIIERRPIN